MSVAASDLGFCDLHVHSNVSDGEKTPRELVEMAEQLHLSAVALCDHNTVEGIPDFVQAAANVAVDAVPGTEITADFGGKEVHILGLFLDVANLKEIEDFVSQISAYKEESNLNLARNLKAIGIDIDYGTIVANANGPYVNRVHFAKAMKSAGYVESISEAFETYLNKENGYYVPAKRLDAFDVIRFLVEVGALPVLAHPLISLSYEDLVAFLPQAKRVGLAAMETNYSLYDASQTDTAIALANRFGLLLSGGSDYHGVNKPDIRMGIGKGNLFVPADYYEKMKTILQRKE